MTWAAFRARLIAAVFGLLLAIGAASAPAIAQTVHPLHRQLLLELQALGLTPAQGMPLLAEGLARAVPGTAAESAARNAGIRQLVQNGLSHSARFVQSVTGRLQYLRTIGALTAANASTQLARASTWVGGRGGAFPRGGSIALEPFLKLFAVAVVGTRSYHEGREFTEVALFELERAADEAEARAYADLMESLVMQTTKGRLVLCDGMDYAEAATRLRINMQTAPGRSPYWRIICRPGEGASDPAAGGVCRERGAALKARIAERRWDASVSTRYDSAPYVEGAAGVLCHFRATGHFYAAAGEGFRRYEWRDGAWVHVLTIEVEKRYQDAKGRQVAEGRGRAPGEPLGDMTYWVTRY